MLKLNLKYNRLTYYWSTNNLFKNRVNPWIDTTNAFNIMRDIWFKKVFKYNLEFFKTDGILNGIKSISQLSVKIKMFLEIHL